jgi:hypothetical protein
VPPPIAKLTIFTQSDLRPVKVMICSLVWNDINCQGRSSLRKVPSK